MVWFDADETILNNADETILNNARHRQYCQCSSSTRKKCTYFSESIAHKWDKYKAFVEHSSTVTKSVPSLDLRSAWSTSWDRRFWEVSAWQQLLGKALSLFLSSCTPGSSLYCLCVVLFVRRGYKDRRLPGTDSRQETTVACYILVVLIRTTEPQAIFFTLGQLEGNSSMSLHPSAGLCRSTWRGVWIRWTGTVEWNGGMDWTGMEWNDQRNVALSWASPTFAL